MLKDRALIPTAEISEISAVLPEQLKDQESSGSEFLCLKGRYCSDKLKRK